MAVLEKIEEAARLLKVAAEELEKSTILELSYKITIKPQRSTSTLIPTTDPGENFPPLK